MSLANLILENSENSYISGLLFASLTDIVYEVDTAARRERYELLGLQEYDTIFQNLLLIGDIEASILRSENKLIVVFRGSEGFDEAPNVIDWLSNANIATVPFCGTAFIHQGFANLASLFVPEILARIRRLSSIEEIWLTGHSLGGAIAQAVGYCLHTLHPIRVRRVVTFGAPRIGGSVKWALPAKLSGFNLDYWVNLGDPVPRLPSIGVHLPGDPRAPLPVIWKHYGRLNYIDWTESQINLDINKALGPLINVGVLDFDDHRIVSYKHRIFDLMPDIELELLLRFFTASFSLRYLLERAAFDNGEAPENYSLIDLFVASGFSDARYSTRQLMLRFL